LLFEWRMAEFQNPLILQMPGEQRAPIVLTSPHSGRRYPDEFVAVSRLDATAIRRSEDSFVDEIFSAGPAIGLPMLAAAFPRAYCDVNREAWELDPSMFEDSLPDFVNAASPRVLAGLGTIARIVGTGEPIYRHKMRFAEAEARIAACWQPYHAALQDLIDQSLSKFGMCLVIDCHSMPSTPGQRSQRVADVVLGDVHGTSCSPQMTGFIETKLTRLGLRVRRNDPYAGGYITRHYGRPRQNIHVLQIEMLRSLYMNEARFEKSARFEDVAAVISKLLSALVDVSAVLLQAPLIDSAAAAE
jgi:N-formylglutamate deformylase